MAEDWGEGFIRTHQIEILRFAQYDSMTFAISCFPLLGRGIKGEGLIKKKKNPLSKLYLFAEAQRQFPSLPRREPIKSVILSEAKNL